MRKEHTRWTQKRLDDLRKDGKTMTVREAAAKRGMTAASIRKARWRYGIDFVQECRNPVTDKAAGIEKALDNFLRRAA